MATLAGVPISAVDTSTHLIQSKFDTSNFLPAITAKFIFPDTPDDLYKARGRMHDFTKDLKSLGCLGEGNIYICDPLPERNQALKNALGFRRDLKMQLYLDNL